MATPHDFSSVGWYSLGVHPGGAGNAVMAGHVNNALTKAGVFEHLSDMHVGDTVRIADAQGKTLTYVVTETASYATTDAPVADIFATGGPSQLVLITCDGDWDGAAHSFTKRFVVYARLVSSV